MGELLSGAALARQQSYTSDKARALGLFAPQPETESREARLHRMPAETQARLTAYLGKLTGTAPLMEYALGIVDYILGLREDYPARPVAAVAYVTEEALEGCETVVIGMLSVAPAAEQAPKAPKEKKPRQRQAQQAPKAINSSPAEQPGSSSPAEQAGPEAIPPQQAPSSPAAAIAEQAPAAAAPVLAPAKYRRNKSVAAVQMSLFSEV